MSICEACIKSNEHKLNIHKIINCTVDEKGWHHSFDDEPSRTQTNKSKRWHKHGILHRPNSFAKIGYYQSGNISRTWFYNGIEAIDGYQCKVKDVITTTTRICPQYNLQGDDLGNRISIIPKGSVILITKQLSDIMFEGLWGNKKLYFVTNHG